MKVDMLESIKRIILGQWHMHTHTQKKVQLNSQKYNLIFRNIGEFDWEFVTNRWLRV
jgi:hypothetical protein